MMDVRTENQLVELVLWDTMAQEDYDRLRPLTYPDTHIVLICFSVEIRESLENVEVRWVPEVTHFCPGVPFLLVACKTDLRNNQNTLQEQTFITSEAGDKMAKRIGAKAYLECSAKTGEGVEQVFQTAATIALRGTSKANHKSCILL
jgi:small GTP-binding protein